MQWSTFPIEIDTVSNWVDSKIPRESITDIKWYSIQVAIYLQNLWLFFIM